MNYLIFLMALAGVIAHYLAKYLDTLTTKDTFNWKQHLIFACYSCVVIVAILFGWEKVGIGLELNTWTAFLMGYFADSLVKNLTKFNPFDKTA